MTDNTTHVVLGAGPAGSTIVEELLRRGLPVRHVNLRPIDDVPDGVETATADVSDPAQARGATAGAAAIYHAATCPITSRSD